MDASSRQATRRCAPPTLHSTMADAPAAVAGVKRERDEAKGKGPMAPPSTRVKDAAVCCPLVYGSLAFWLGRKADEFHTHKWTLFVRGPHGEDLGYFVEKVVFKLHPSFAQPVREITKPPFEVSEKGWGEFECHIRIHFKDLTEKPLEVAHIVKLYDGTTPQAANQPVVSEFYDEVVFTDPRTEFHAELMNATKQPMEPHPLNAHFTTFEDAPEVETLVKAGEYVAGQLQTVKDSIARLDHQIGLARQLEQSRAAQEHAAHQQAAAQRAAQQQRAQAQRAAQPGYK